jgi:hypothetical protein
MGSITNAGFDFLVRYPTADKSHLNILYEMKYSDPLSLYPANLNKAMIKECYATTGIRTREGRRITQ